MIDTAKGIAAGVKLKAGEELWRDYYFPKKRFTDSLPIGVVLTIPAAGSEASFGSVLTHDELRMKRYTGGEPLTPALPFSIRTQTTLPPYQTACGILDIVAHLLERYLSIPGCGLSDH